MILENAVNHGGHSEHSEKLELMMDYPINRWVSAKNGLKLKLFAVPAVPAVVKLSFVE